MIFVKEDEAELDMSQIIYDYACLALPMQRVHEDGECDPEAMKYYGGPSEDEDQEQEEGTSPFAALKDIFK